MNDQEIQMLVGVISAVLTACVFPFVLYFFKQNQRLHEETRNKIGTHDTTLALHNIRILSLEEWRTYQMQGIIPQQVHPQQPPTSPVTINN